MLDKSAQLTPEQVMEEASRLSIDSITAIPIACRLVARFAADPWELDLNEIEGDGLEPVATGWVRPQRTNALVDAGDYMTLSAADARMLWDAVRVLPFLVRRIRDLERVPR